MIRIVAIAGTKSGIDSLTQELFCSQYFNLGFIDPPNEMKEFIEKRLNNENLLNDRT